MPSDTTPPIGAKPAPSGSTPPQPGGSSPLISVIIVCKDPGPRLKEAIASIWAQHVSPLPEIIVVDGGSEDGSRVWLVSQRPRLGTLIMEPDKGIYEAMNKGVAAARGEWVFFLGADDKFYHDAVLNRAQGELKQTTAGIAVGEIAYEDGRIYRYEANPNRVARNFVHHQGAFYRRSLFTDCGTFDPSLMVMGDYDFNLRVWKKGVAFATLPLRITTCGVGGLSDSGQWLGYGEEIKVRHRYFSSLACLLWDAGSVVRFIRKMFVKRPKAH